MHILYCGPISLQLLAPIMGGCIPVDLKGYEYPQGAYLCHEYQRKGHKLSIVTCANEVKESQNFSHNNITVTIHPRRRVWKMMLDGFGKERRFIIESINQLSPDIIHAQWSYEFAAAALSTPYRSVITLRDAPWTIALHSRSIYRIYRAIFARRILAKANTLAAVSPVVADAIKQQYHLSKTIHIIPNGIDTQPQESNLPGETKTKRLLAITSWQRLKNVKLLICAFKIARARDPDFELVLVGSNLGEGEAAEKWAIKHEASSGINFVGKQPHAVVKNYLKQDFAGFIHTSKEESFGMTILEAMAHRLPVICCPNSGAPPWLLNNGDAGFIASKASPEAVAVEICKLVADQGLVNKKTENALKRVSDLFTLDKVADSYIGLFRKTITQHKQ